MSNNSQPTTIKPEAKQTAKALKKSGNTIGHNYVIIKSLKQSPKNDVVKCFYMKSLIDFGFCVIKEGSCNDLKDKNGRDIKDRLVWQKHMHETLKNKVRVPKLIGSFEENGNYYLAIELISGNSLSAILRKHGAKVRSGLISGNRLGKRILKYLIQFSRLLETLHKNNVVHRDVTTTNFMVNRFGRAFLIDMELSYSLAQQSPNPPFQLGTHGYMSPEQLLALQPSINEDVFAFGAIILQVWSNIAPVKLTDELPEDLLKKVNYFIPDSKIASIVFSCLSKEPANRPSLQLVREAITDYYRDFSRKSNRNVNQVDRFSDNDIKQIIQSTINTLSSTMLSDEERGWFAEDKNAEKNGGRDKSKMSKAWYASFYLGGSGVLYMLARAKQFGYDTSPNVSNIDKTIQLIDRKYIQTDDSLTGMYFGADGVAVSLAAALKGNLIERSPVYEDWIETLLSKDSKPGPDIMNGAAGRVMANLICYSQLPTQSTVSRLKLYVDQIVAQQEGGAWIRSKTAKGKMRVTKGFAYGVAGITYALLEYSRVFNDSRSLESAVAALDWLIRSAKWKANKMYWTSSIGKLVDPWWIDGGPGVALSFIKAYELTQNVKYKNYAIAALVREDEDIFYSNLSQANGLSGLGEIYLEAYRVFKDEVWLRKSDSIAQMLMRLVKKSPKYGTYWLCESEQQPIPGFMLGNTGILHFLVRFLNHPRLSLPLAMDFLAPLSKTNSVQPVERIIM